MKLEGGRKIAPTIKAWSMPKSLSCAHRARPQAIRRLGGYKVQRLHRRAPRRRRAPSPKPGHSALCSNASRESCRQDHRASPIPTIGIGAGPHCDGQVLVLHDLLGLLEGAHQHKFVRQYAELGSQIRTAVAEYVADVAEGRFPVDRESFR